MEAPQRAVPLMSTRGSSSESVPTDTHVKISVYSLQQKHGLGLHGQFPLTEQLYTKWISLVYITLRPKVCIIRGVASLKRAEAAIANYRRVS